MKFSLPLNPKLSEQDFYQLVNFCKQNKEHIYDIYFTCRIAPFLQDAMGDIFIQTEDNLFAIDTALHIQQETGIPVSATFNNIEVRPDQRNLDIWIKNFKPLYDKGVRSCTLPHTTWMLTGQIQKEFPELFIKNTILRAVKEPREVAQLAEAGFHYVNLDRVLMRDHDRLREIKRVKEKYDIKISLLANESCIGGCSIMSEHYQFNNTRSNKPQYFTDPISRVSCAHWNNNDTAIALKTANFTPFREDWLDFEDLGIDVIKMHGRESIQMFHETMSIVNNYIKGEEILYPGFEEYLETSNLENRPINAWRKKIKTCKFDCWDCSFCDDVWHARGNTNNKKIEAVSNAIVDSINSSYDNDIVGLTSSRTKKLLNELGKLSTSYLEIGALNGATFCAAIENNSMKAVAIDMWKDPIESADGKIKISPSKETFIENVKKVKGTNSINVYHSDFRIVDKQYIDYIDFMFYDADHSAEMTAQAVQYFADKFKDETILVFDDANFDGVVAGAREGIAKAGLEIMFDRVILNELEDPTQWWNGLYITLVRKS
jgi:predicted O-methyltransferase YrrM